jgi:cobalamin biosynthesis Mg chelatase CobN
MSLALLLLACVVGHQPSFSFDSVDVDSTEWIADSLYYQSNPQPVQAETVYVLSYAMDASQEEDSAPSPFIVLPLVVIAVVLTLFAIRWILGECIGWR